mgnify:CR=1 FL=1
MSKNSELSFSNFDMNKDIKNIKHLCFELMHKPLPTEFRSPVRWSPGLLDMELFHIIIQIISTYTLGIKDLSIFPEIDTLEYSSGMSIVLSLKNCESKEQALYFLKYYSSQLFQQSC